MVGLLRVRRLPTRRQSLAHHRGRGSRNRLGSKGWPFICRVEVQSTSATVWIVRPCAHCSHTYIAYFVSPFPPTRMYSPCCPDVHTVLLYRLISHGLVLISEWWGFALL